MGLDMNLYKKHYVKNWEHTAPNKRTEIEVKVGGKKATHIDMSKVAYIEEDVAYWRKANQIHKWFIDNCADGEADKTEMYVDREQLVRLLGVVKKVLKSIKLVKGKIKNGYRYENGKEVAIMEDGMTIVDSSVAQELLPTEDGFFFGSTDYDQYYVEDLKKTKKMLEETLRKDTTDSSPEYRYSASW